MNLSDARAISPSLITRPATPEADHHMLLRLAHWCERYTPITACDGEDGLMLDITGCTHLFGGEENLMKDLSQRLKALGFENRLGLAPTKGAAWAFARFTPFNPNNKQANKKTPIRAHPPLHETLSPLPIEALRLSEESAQRLKRFGLKHIHQLLNLPRQSLKRRFRSPKIAHDVLNRLDQAFAAKAEPLIPLTPIPAYAVRQNFPEPLLATESFTMSLNKLLESLCTKLEKDHKGARHLTFSAHHADGGLSRITIATARPSRNPSHLANLFAEKIEHLNPGFGVDILVLSADRTEHLLEKQCDLNQLNADNTNHDNAYRGDLDALLDRLINRLGPKAIARKSPVASHIPERAEKAAPPTQLPSWQQTNTPTKPHRPLRLFAKPETIQVVAEIPDGPPKLFRWRRVLRRVVKSTGSERISPEWWRLEDQETQEGQDEGTRDYYHVEDEEGRRYWIFRKGLYSEGRQNDQNCQNSRQDEEGNEEEADKHKAPLPLWHIHGLYA